MIKSIEIAIKKDLAQPFYAVMDATSVFYKIQYSCGLTRARTINALCYYLSKCFHFKAKKCTVLLYQIWITHIGECFHTTNAVQVRHYF